MLREKGIITSGSYYDYMLLIWRAKTFDQLDEYRRKQDFGQGGKWVQGSVHIIHRVFSSPLPGDRARARS